MAVSRSVVREIANDLRLFLTTNDWRPTTHLWLSTYLEPLKKNKSLSTN